MHRRPFAYAGTVRDFVGARTEELIGTLAEHDARRALWGATDAAQLRAWRSSIDWLRSALGETLDRDAGAGGWGVCLEYEIPRRGGRVDAAVFTGDVLVVIEFKATNADPQSRRQVEDYCLELRDFHSGSHRLPMSPVVCARDAPVEIAERHPEQQVDGVTTTSPEQLGEVIVQLVGGQRSDALVEWDEWLSAPYSPTPTIIEAAQALYRGHHIRELSLSQANAEQLERTERALSNVVRQAHIDRSNVACFVTGVPGAGKTLAGLNVVHELEENEDATFVSGNGPLVKVLQEVLATDLAAREDVTKAEARRRATTLITNVHRWLDEYGEKHPDRIPHESVIVFDEAQRAWDREQSKRKFGRTSSEPEMMLDVMSRRSPSVLVGLVGGGQEINTGEAGLSEWGRALAGRFKDWRIVVSPEMLTGELQAGSTLFGSSEAIGLDRISTSADLHLGVSRRSFRAETLSSWVEHVLAGSADEASVDLEFLRSYPIVVCRDLDVARDWLRARARGLRRAGLLVSSGARRLRPYGIAVRERINEVDWFLRAPEDVRSSSFLELAISEFGIQGLEVDWACLAWGGDFTRHDNEWDIRKFEGTRWKAVHSGAAREYARNRYRVLLTRAREGLVIWVPKGDARDATRDPARFDAVAEFLIRCGAKTIGS